MAFWFLCYSLVMPYLWISLSWLGIRKELLDNSGKQGCCLQSVSSFLSKRRLCQIFRVYSFHSFWSYSWNFCKNFEDISRNSFCGFPLFPLVSCPLSRLISSVSNCCSYFLLSFILKILIKYNLNMIEILKKSLNFEHLTYFGKMVNQIWLLNCVKRGKSRNHLIEIIQGARDKTDN